MLNSYVQCICNALTHAHPFTEGVCAYKWFFYIFIDSDVPVCRIKYPIYIPRARLLSCCHWNKNGYVSIRMKLMGMIRYFFKLHSSIDFRSLVGRCMRVPFAFNWNGRILWIFASCSFLVWTFEWMRAGGRTVWKIETNNNWLLLGAILHLANELCWFSDIDFWTAHYRKWEAWFATANEMREGGMKEGGSHKSHELLI